MRVLRIYPGANDPRHRHREAALVRQGVDIGLILPERYGADWMATPLDLPIPNWRARIWNRKSIPFHTWPQRLLSKAVRDFRPDVVDVHEEPYILAGMQGVIAARGRPVVMYAAQNLNKALPPPFGRLQAWNFRRTFGFYACSQDAAAVLRARGFDGRVDVIPLGADPELFEIDATGDRVGFIGRFVPEKGVADLLQFGSRLLCIGDGPLRGDLVSAGAEVERAGGVDDLARALSRMAVLVAPSLTVRHWKEQFGRMAVEAMAAGIPVVGYASGSLPEVVGDGGILVAEGDRSALAAAVEVALADRVRLGELARRRARRLFNWDAIAEGQKELYEAAAES